MSLEVHTAIAAHGGSVIYSVELDAQGRNVGRGQSGGVQRARRCGACGDVGHDRKRCNGKGRPPKPLRYPTFVQRASGAPCRVCGETGHDVRRHNGGKARRAA